MNELQVCVNNDGSMCYHQNKVLLYDKTGALYLAPFTETETETRVHAEKATPYKSTGAQTSLECQDQDQENNESIEAVEGSSGNGKHTWTKPETLLLFTQYASLMPKVESREIKSKKKMWQIMSQQFEKELCNLSAGQIENRWKTLVRDYLKTKAHNKRTGVQRKECAFEKDLDELLIGKHNVEPPVILGRNGLREHNLVGNDELEGNDDLELGVDGEHEVSTVTPSPTPSTSNSGTPVPKVNTTARRLAECGKALNTIAESMERKEKETMKFHEEIVNLYRADVESAQQFGREYISKQEEKLQLLKELFKK